MTATTWYHCPICGRRIKLETSIYSSHTGNRYCRDLTSCHARADKQRVGERRVKVASQ